MLKKLQYSLVFRWLTSSYFIPQLPCVGKRSGHFRDHQPIDKRATFSSSLAGFGSGTALDPDNTKHREDVFHADILAQKALAAEAGPETRFDVAKLV